MTLIATCTRPLPADVGGVTQWFAENPAVYSQFGLAGHNGLDYGAPAGTPVLAAWAGTCSVGSDPQGYGNFVHVTNGMAVMLYAHLRRVLVAEGDKVSAEQPLGEVGSTGFSTGSHLHWGIKFLNGRNPAYRDWVDPLPFRVVGMAQQSSSVARQASRRILRTVYSVEQRDWRWVVVTGKGTTGGLTVLQARAEARQRNG